jgi:hypothetical protein
MRMNLAGAPAMTALAGTPFVTTAPALTIAPWQIVTPAPRHTWRPPVSEVSD